ncbi:CHRD domain-containing protein [Nonomuraea typhae]|uniref:CHRD domain-containing protein n=1 Tax=Nonomuraea typhae TaxID=2603600 RepID=UPI0012F736A2|nr:CHRD domain-containing protein [Nonomuraea typhae]
MRKHLAVVGFTAAAAVLVTSLPAAAATAAQDHRPRVVKLSGKQEVPGPGDRNGSGFFAWRAHHGRLCYRLAVRRIGTPTAAHIHQGRRGVAGAITVALKTPADGFSRGCVKAVKRQNAANAATTLTFAELRAIRKWPHRYYVNVHNKRFPMGAIRGQL